jgi:hypothetical protein
VNTLFKNIVLASMTIALAQPALAQGTTNQAKAVDPKLQGRPVQAVKPPMPSGSHDEYLTKGPEPMKQKQNLDGIPEYTGKARFLQGLYYDHVGKQGPNYVMMFNTKETKEQVKDWYQSVFGTYGWKTLHSDKDALMATNKDGNTCTIQIGGPVPGLSAKDDRGSYTIRYQYAK